MFTYDSSSFAYDSNPYPRLTVAGTGYLGATHAVCMALLGFEVLGFDTDRDKIERLAAGELPFYEPACRNCSPSRWTRAGCSSHRRSRRPPRSATFTSSAWHPATRRFGSVALAEGKTRQA